MTKKRRNSPWPEFKFFQGDWRVMDEVGGKYVPRVIIQETQSKLWVPTTVCD